MKQGQLERAIRRALTQFEKWNDATGCFTKDTSYYYEMQGIIEDAVHCGAQESTGDYKPLEGELDDSILPLTTPVKVSITIPDGFNMTADLVRVTNLVVALLAAGMSTDVIMRHLTKEPDHTGVVI